MKSSISLVIVIFGLIVHATILCANAQTMEDPPIGILLAAGDISTCGNEKWQHYANETATIIRKVVKESQSAQPTIPVRVLALGDLAYGKGTKSQFDCFAARWSGFDDILLPVPGNHEYLTPDAKPYFEYFKDNRFVQQNGKEKGYFAVNFPREDGPWQLIGLNAHIKQNGAMADQLKWLGTTLGAPGGNPSPCILAFWHAPTFSSGRHGHDYKTQAHAPLTKERPMQEALRSLFEHGASVVLAGHDHDYEQFGRHDADGNAAEDGVRSFVVGTGGSLLTQDDYVNIAPNSEGLYGRNKGMQGVLKIVLFERRYEWDFLSIDGATTLPLKTKKDDCIARKNPTE
jgi:hypothetical protein